jgi:hypothetical protein
MPALGSQFWLFLLHLGDLGEKPDVPTLLDSDLWVFNVVQWTAMECPAIHCVEYLHIHVVARILIYLKSNM